MFPKPVKHSGKESCIIYRADNVQTKIGSFQAGFPGLRCREWLCRSDPASHTERFKSSVRPAAAPPIRNGSPPTLPDSPKLSPTLPRLSPTLARLSCLGFLLHMSVR